MTSGFDPATASDAEKIREAVKWFDTWDKLAERIVIEKAEDEVVVADLTRGTEIQADLLRIADRLEVLDAGVVNHKTWAEFKAWAEFLAAYVDYHHGKAISDRAWDLYVRGNKPYDD